MEIPIISYEKFVAFVARPSQARIPVKTHHTHVDKVYIVFNIPCFLNTS